MRRTMQVALLLSFVLGLGARAAWAGWEEGVAAFRAGDYATAIWELKGVVERSPKYAPAHYMLGLSLLQAGHADEAVTRLVTAVELAAGTAEEAGYRIELAAAQVGAGHAATAVEVLSPIDPAKLAEGSGPRYAARLAKASLTLEDPAPTVPLLERAVAALPSEAPLWMALGRARGLADDAPAAFEAWERARQLAPDDLTAAQQSSRIAYNLGAAAKGKEAIRWFERSAVPAEAVASARGSLDDLLLAGEARLGAHQYQAAVGWFEKAVAMEPTQPLPTYYLGRSLLAAGKVEPARERLERALGLHPDRELAQKVHRALGLAHYQGGDYAASAAAYRKAGDEAAAVHAEGAGDIADVWNRDAASCRERNEVFRDMREQMRDFEGTDLWQDFVRRYETFLRDCRQHLGDAEVLSLD